MNSSQATTATVNATPSSPNEWEHKQPHIVTAIIIALIVLTLVGCAVVFYIGLQGANTTPNHAALANLAADLLI